jgi:hypothetical protein
MLPATTSMIKIKANKSHCFFEKHGSPAKARGKTSKGSFMRNTDNHSCLSLLQKPDNSGKRNSRHILHRRGEEKKFLKWPFMSLCRKVETTKIAMQTESVPREKNNATIIPPRLRKRRCFRQSFISCLSWFIVAIYRTR